DFRLIRLPQRRVTGADRLASGLAQNLRDPDLAKIGCGQTALSGNNDVSAFGIYHAAAMAAGLRHVVSMAPEISQLGALAPNHEQRWSRTEGFPALARRSIAARQAQIGQGRVHACAHDLSVPPAYFVHSVRGACGPAIAQIVD